MGLYLDRIDAAAPAEKWPLVRQLMTGERAPFFHELQRERPVLELPELTFVTRHADCTIVLQRWHDFGVDLYKPKQGDYFMAQDDTADHWREKSIMKSILDFEDIPLIRKFVGERAAAILREGRGRIDAPQALTRMVPVGLVQEFFGFASGDPKKLIDWSYWNQQDAFHNQPFDTDVTPDPAHVISERKRANIHLAFFLGRVLLKRVVQVKMGSGRTDSVSRLVRLSFSKGVKFPLKEVLLNAGGLLIGAVETTNHAVNNAMAALFAKPDVLAQAKAAAAKDDPAEFDGFVAEALRFNPAFPYFFRTCHTPTLLGGGTGHAVTVQPGTTVLACTHAGMFDPAAYADPERFDPSRSIWQTFTYGYGHHECLGRAISAAMVPEIVRQVLRLPGIEEESPIVYEGGVPEHYPLRWAA
ncbi:MAG TPA: cytochrome P450 [Allosphingosinicella sp.]